MFVAPPVVDANDNGPDSTMKAVGDVEGVIVLKRRRFNNVPMFNADMWR